MCVLALIVLTFVPVCAVVNGQALDTKAEENVFDFITEVMGIDTSKYEVTHHSCSASYPSNLGGSVKEELTTLVLNSNDGSSIQASVLFDNGYMSTAFFYLDGQVIKEQQYNVSTLEKAKDIILRYQNFSSKLGISSDEVSSALLMLSSVTELSSLTVTNGNMKMQIKCSEPNSETRLEYNTKIEFVYTDNGVDSTWKCFSLGFCCSYGVTKFVFADTWGLFSTYSADLPCLSKSDAADIAWDAAKNYQIELLNTDDNSTISVTPNWPETLTFESSMVMAAGQLYNDSRLIDLNMGSSSRDGLTLYPLWKFLFYFDEPMGDMQGIQVGVWGDTKEIAYCGTYGFFGVSATSSPSPDSAPSQPIDSSVPFDAWLVVFVAVLGLAIAALSAVVLKKRKRTLQTEPTASAQTSN